MLVTFDIKKVNGVVVRKVVESGKITVDKMSRSKTQKLLEVLCG